MSVNLHEVLHELQRGVIQCAVSTPAESPLLALSPASGATVLFGLSACGLHVTKNELQLHGVQQLILLALLLCGCATIWKLG